jgi:hypothetical protein
VAQVALLVYPALVDNLAILAYRAILASRALAVSLANQVFLALAENLVTVVLVGSVAYLVTVVTAGHPAFPVLVVLLVCLASVDSAANLDSLASVAQADIQALAAHQAFLVKVAPAVTPVTVAHLGSVVPVDRVV